MSVKDDPLDRALLQEAQELDLGGGCHVLQDRVVRGEVAHPESLDLGGFRDVVLPPDDDGRLGASGAEVEDG